MHLLFSTSGLLKLPVVTSATALNQRPRVTRWRGHIEFEEHGKHQKLFSSLNWANVLVDVLLWTRISVCILQTLFLSKWSSYCQMGQSRPNCPNFISTEADDEIRFIQVAVALLLAQLEPVSFAPSRSLRGHRHQIADKIGTTWIASWLLRCTFVLGVLWKNDCCVEHSETCEMPSKSDLNNKWSVDLSPTIECLEQSPDDFLCPRPSRPSALGHRKSISSLLQLHKLTRTFHKLPLHIRIASGTSRKTWRKCSNALYSVGWTGGKHQLNMCNTLWSFILLCCPSLNRRGEVKSVVITNKDHLEHLAGWKRN